MSNPAEAKALVQMLKPITIDQIGTRAWKEQRDAVEKLNHAAHLNARAKKDDFVMQFLIEEEKMVVLLHELLTAEVWRQRIMGECIPALLENPTGVYMYCYYESVLVNLFECLLFFEEAVVALGDDLLELIDYAWRNVSSAFHMGSKVNEIPKEPTADVGEGEERFWLQVNQLHANVSMACISLLWFIVDRMKALPLAALNSVLIKNDLLVGMSEVVEQQPWMRRDKKATPPRLQKFKGGKFEDIKQEDQLLVCGPEAHAWFILHYLLCDRDARTKYQYTKSKKELIMRLKKYLHETLIDQLPALMDVQRAIEELNFLEPPTGTEEKFKSSLLVEHVPRIMGSIEGAGSGKGGRDWKQLIEVMRRAITAPEARMEDARRYAALFEELYHPE